MPAPNNAPTNDEAKKIIRVGNNINIAMPKSVPSARRVKSTPRTSGGRLQPRINLSHVIFLCPYEMYELITNVKNISSIKVSVDGDTFIGIPLT
jgi:hypothetical protein